MKQSGVPIEHYRLHQNNSPPHTVASILLQLDVLGFGRVDHCPYSTYLATFDFDVYLKVKSQLKGRWYSSRPELCSATANIISQYNQDWYRAFFNTWVKQHWKCIAYNGEYFDATGVANSFPSMLHIGRGACVQSPICHWEMVTCLSLFQFL